MRRDRGRQPVDQIGRRHGQPQAPGATFREQAVEEGEMAPEVADGDDREAPAGQRVVGVVPFRPLRVEPDAALRNEVRQLHERRHEQFLGERKQPRRSVGGRLQRAVGADLGRPFPQGAVQDRVEGDRVPGVAEQVVETGDPVRDDRGAVQG